MGTIQGFSNQIGSWRSSFPRSKEAQMCDNKKELISQAHAARLAGVQIERKDAVELIKKLDTPDTFFYIDPPYVGANQGHYGGYAQEHFNALLEVLAGIKGKFLLSSYPNAVLDEYRVKKGWKNADVLMNLTAANQAGRKKTECLTMNY